MKSDVRKLSDLCVGGGSYGIAAPAVPFSKELPTYLRITDINDDGTLNVDGFMSVDDERAGCYYLQPGDIVFARTGASAGRSYFYDGTEGRFVYAGFLIKFSLDPHKVNPLFVKYYCLSKNYFNWVSSVNTGSTRGNINARTFAHLPVPILPREQQDLLADTLSLLDAKIAVNKKINRHLEQMAQAVFRQVLIEECAGEPMGVLSDIAEINPPRFLRRGQEAVYIEMARLPVRGACPENWEMRPFEGSGMRFTNGDTLMARITPCLENGKAARLREEAEAVQETFKELSAKRDDLNNRLRQTKTALEELRRAAADFEKNEQSYAAVKQLADTANGKLDFETYAQMAYFERVIAAANLRLRLMSQNRYTLLRKTGSADGRKRSGLELEVLDAYTGKARSANSLSGGESFMASLSLALGLSDIVQQSAGGIRLDAMFIDEGFGALDADVLELAVRTLSEMAGENRIIGIISHVAELRERIDKQIWVEKTIAGSRVSLVV